MKYVNKRTGAIIETDSVLGGGWVPAEKPKKEDKPVTKKGKAKK